MIENASKNVLHERNQDLVVGLELLDIGSKLLDFGLDGLGLALPGQLGIELALALLQTRAKRFRLFNDRAHHPEDGICGSLAKSANFGPKKQETNNK